MQNIIKKIINDTANKYELDNTILTNYIAHSIHKLLNCLVKPTEAHSTLQWNNKTPKLITEVLKIMKTDNALDIDPVSFYYFTNHLDALKKNVLIEHAFGLIDDPSQFLA